MRYFFIRVNGDTVHNNPENKDSYVPNEPPKFPLTKFNYFNYCLENNIVRTGSPDVGDLIKGDKYGSLTKAYSINSIKTRFRNLLKLFCEIKCGEIILMPDKDKAGDICIGKVSKTYEYYHDVPEHPYECAQRIGVEWNADSSGKAIVYKVADFDIKMNGWWVQAFHELKNSSVRDTIIIDRINSTFALTEKSKINLDLINFNCKKLTEIAKEIRRNTGKKQPQPHEIFSAWEKKHNKTLDEKNREKLIQKCFRKK